MEDRTYLYSGNAWFKEQLDGPDGHLWCRARKMFLFDRSLSSALNLFKFDYRAIKAISRPEGIDLVIHKSNTLTNNDEQDNRPGRAWIDDAQDSIRILLDRIVTMWQPRFLTQKRINMHHLHRNLTPVPLQMVKVNYDGTDDGVNNFNVQMALKNYQDTLVPLHYHELWAEIVHDYKNIETNLETRRTTMKFAETFKKETLDETEDTALVLGTNQIIYVDNFKRLTTKPGLFDVVLLKVHNEEYFGMVVHVEQNKVKNKSIDETSNTIPTHQPRDLKYELFTTIGLYTSRKCSDAIETFRKKTKSDQLEMTKISNITSSRRMISAIHNISGWPFHKSILKPTVDDPYFELPAEYDPQSVFESDQFNLPQSKVINIAERMFDDLQEHMHLVHGPPGTGKSRTIAAIVLRLLQKVSSKRKILLCAPSNNACDELCRRILDEFQRQNIDPPKGMLVRVSCQPPDDYRLCDHFLDFMVLQDMVNVLKTERRVEDNLAKSTETRLIRHAKIVVSTLNYCGSSRMSAMRKHTDFIIIDEACQSLEGDLLIPFRFNCPKVMLVGDPLQLPPCVLSDAGKTYGLSQSLYARLYSIFNQNVDGPITMLDTQYRMHPEICRFPSHQFYEKKLFTHESVTSKARNFSLRPLFLYNLTQSFHQQEDDGSSFNEGEASFIQKFLAKLIQHMANEIDEDSDDDDDEDEEEEEDDQEEEDIFTLESASSENESSSSKLSNQNEKEPSVPPFIPLDDPRAIEVQKRIAIITPYHGQIRRLRRRLPPAVEIMTVDSAQGKEKDIIIISCVRSGGTIGFLDDINRMNVMLTRSRNALYIVGNFTQLAAQHPCWNKLLQDAHARHIIENVGADVPDLPYI